MHRMTPWALVMMLAACLGASVQAQGLAGSAWGARGWLADRGIAVDVLYTADALYVARGGLERRGAWLHNVDAVLTVDADVLLGWPGATVAVYGLATYSPDLTGAVGDIQGVSNIEAPDAVQVFEAWVEQGLGGSASVRAGLYALDSEFYVLETAALFVHSSPGTGPTLGQHAPSIFPRAALGVRARVEVGRARYLLAALTDGRPGELAGAAARTRWNVDDMLVNAEIGLQRHEGASYRKVALGAWRFAEHRATLRAQAGVAPATQEAATYGVYGLAERSWPLAAGRALALFARAGTSRSAVCPIGAAWGVGAVVRGAGGQAGLSVSTAHGSAAFRDVLRATTAAAPRAEWSFEATLGRTIRPGLWLQPNVQLIVHPGLRSGTPAALVAGGRLIATL